MYLCYLIGNGRYTYVGITNNLTRRLRQHNKELVGGARYTTMRYNPASPWRPVALIVNIEHHSDALSVEWHVKRRRRQGAQKGKLAMQTVLQRYKNGLHTGRDGTLWDYVEA